MKHIVNAAILAASTVVSFATASAGARDVQATIPFAFQVGNVTLPAGRYTLSSDHGSPFLRISNREKGITEVAVGSPGPFKASSPYALVFEHYGDQYFLQEMVHGDTQFGVYFTPSKAEKAAKLRAQEARPSESRLRVDETVQVATIR